MLAGGLHGIEHELPLEEELVGNAYDSDKPQVPHTMAEARERFAASDLARAAFGDEVVAHYTNMADVELAAYGAAVTDWELRRGFERL
jgi:glutamine synthetase